VGSFVSNTIQEAPLPVAESTTPDLRAMADQDHPAGPLFSTPFVENELTNNDPFVNCSLATGSRTILCCA
jgi:hypothetical protein